VVDFPIPQLYRLAEVVSQPLLPSCLYAAGEHELPAGATRLPWGESPRPLVGEFARWQGSSVPGRLVASAKSWLCHAGVDRAAPILPWGAPAEVARLSPVEATTRLLAHLAAAWDCAHPQAPLATQDVVVTVPASFDEVARALTVTAAQRAGLTKLTLVEEPQAAFYDFTARHREQLTKALKEVRLVLVVDVGGGTTDFTLIQVVGTGEGPVLRRLAVGEHLMLGGDNMDAALARAVEARWQAGGRRLSATQWTQLVQAARAAKETLLAECAPERHGVAVVAEGSRLLADTLSADLEQAEVERLILDGFLPFAAPGDAPRREARLALQELGLPYAQDPAITRHLAAFLRQHAAAGYAALGDAASPSPEPGAEPDAWRAAFAGPGGGSTTQAEPGLARAANLPRPDALLLNGGVFNSPKIAERLVDAVSAWWPEAPRLRLLAHDSLDLAVARGAAYYGLVRHGLGRRIGGGTAHALYVGLAAKREEAATQAVCLIPRGHEEGTPVDLTQRPFTLTLGRPVQFPLFSTTSDRVDRPGAVVPLREDFHPLPPIHTLFRGGGGRAAAVPVHLRATLTELGTLELWCVSNVADERWRLEFELRGTRANPKAAVTESMPARFGEARMRLAHCYGHQAAADGAREVRQLLRSIEQVVGPRESWRLPVLRELWAALYAAAKRRRRSPDHERVFYQLAGYSLRPGFGYPLDDWRCEETWRLFAEGVTFHGQAPVWHEFWVLWRRLAGGLTEPQQAELWAYLEPHLARRVPPTPPKSTPKPKGVAPEGLNEMVRTAASLEHLAPAAKGTLGDWIALRLQQPALAAGPWAWALGRLGARAPLYGSGHNTVAAAQAASWLSLLLELGLGNLDGAAFAAVQLARVTGDRTRDLEDDLRERAVAALRAAQAPERWLRMVSEVVELEATDQAQALGDTLPLGLRL